MTETSRIPGFYKLSPEKRMEKIKELAELSEDEVDYLRKTGSLDIEQADQMIENVIGTLELPLGIALNFRINGKDNLLPM